MLVRHRRALRPLLLLASVALGACDEDSGSGGGGQGGDGATTSTTSAPTTATTAMSTTGSGGDDSICTPGEEAPCYTGPSGTEGVGLCAAGVKICNDLGSGYGDCDGDVTPAEETCGNIADEDCDGATNEDGADCSCVPGDTQACYSADPATQDIGACVGGTQVCNAEGTGWGICEGEVVPLAESCVTPADDDCDGEANEADAGCVCTPNEVVACYGGPALTVGLGVCTAGVETCNAQGTAWGPCVGEVVPSVEVCASAVDEDCDGTPSCAAAHVWSMGMGEPSFKDIATDADGNVVLAGQYLTSVDLGGGPLPEPPGVGMVLLKLDPDGNHVWSKGIVGVGFNSALTPVATAVDNDGNIVVVGHVQYLNALDLGGGPLTGAGRLFVAKYDSSGNHLWSHRYGDGSLQQELTDVVTTIDGDVVFGGYFPGALDFGGTTLSSADFYDLFIVKLDAAGNHVWSKRAGGTGQQTVSALAADPSGNILAACYVGGGGADFGAGVVAGSNFVLAKLDPSGALLWTYQPTGGAGSGAGSVSTDSVGNAFVLGSKTGAVNFGGGPTSPFDTNRFIVKVDTSGSHVWSRDLEVTDLGGGAGAWVTATTGDNGLIFSMRFRDTLDLDGGTFSSAGVYDAIVVSLDAAGSYRWAKRFGGAGSDAPLSVAVDGDDNLLLLGDFEGSIDLGGGPITQVDLSSDSFLLKLAP